MSDILCEDEFKTWLDGGEKDIITAHDKALRKENEMLRDALRLSIKAHDDVCECSDGCPHEACAIYADEICTNPESCVGGADIVLECWVKHYILTAERGGAT